MLLCVSVMCFICFHAASSVDVSHFFRTSSEITPRVCSRKYWVPLAKREVWMEKAQLGEALKVTFPPRSSPGNFGVGL